MSIVKRISGEFFNDTKTNCAEVALKARAALRAIKPSDISDGMVEAYIRNFDEKDHGSTYREVLRRAIAAAIAAGAEQ